jgi:DNA-binding protein HU-beta
MNKAELIDVLTEKLGSDRRQATAAVENVVDTIVRAVHKGDSVTITGFGVFEQRRRAARVARNPRTGETVKVKPTSVPAFRPGAQFKAVVSGAQRLPAEGPAVKRGVTAGGARKAVKKAAAKKVVKRAAAKKVVKRAAAKKVVKRAAAKKVVKRGAAKKAVKKAAVKKAVKKAPARKAVKKAAVKKAVRKAPAKRGRR